MVTGGVWVRTGDGRELRSALRAQSSPFGKRWPGPKRAENVVSDRPSRIEPAVRSVPEEFLPGPGVDLLHRDCRKRGRMG